MLKKKSEAVFELEKSGKMQVPAIFIGTEEIVNNIEESVFQQISNVSSLPGVVGKTLCMPDCHTGFGFPVGGVAAFDLNSGIISPGGIGFDINCGVRLLKTNLTLKDVENKIPEIVNKLHKRIPTGTGDEGGYEITHKDLKEILDDGIKWCLKNNYATEKDFEHTEDNGSLDFADEKNVSEQAKKRGLSQIGSLGSGNHYLEIQVLKKENIINKDIAEKLGFFENQILIMIHCGSRGLGHQVATDYIEICKKLPHSKELEDRQLSFAYFNSKEGQAYFSAMGAAANYAFVNRQMITNSVREVFAKIFGGDPIKDLGIELFYDVTHNIAKIEEYKISGKRKQVIVHRKGATRSFGKNRKEVPATYRDLGQPVLIGGSMETGSYVLLGTDFSEKLTFSSTSHGSGRKHSRNTAKKLFNPDEIIKRMTEKGIYIKAPRGTLSEESGEAYKDLDVVIKSIEKANVSIPIVKLVPIGNLKG